MKSSLFAVIVFSWIGIQTQAESNSAKYLIRVQTKTPDYSLSYIPGAIDIAGQDVQRGFIDLVGSREYFELLIEEGYDARIINEQTEGLDSRYMRPQKIWSLIQELKNQRPEIVQIVEIGKSLQGRPLLAVRVSTPDNLNFKPSILFNGMHHAREIMTTEVTTDILSYLVKNFENPQTPWVTDWIRNLAIWVMPQVNPDGNEIVWTSDNWWRKNARSDQGGEIYGVDLNRNYSYEWGKCNGSSGSKDNQTYRGKSPASEPETQAMMKFVREQNFIMNVSYHSYSELVIGPYGCKNQFTPENAIVQQIGLQFAKNLKKDAGNGTYTFGNSWEIIYPVDGDDISWMYNEVNTLAYVVEINSPDQGFQPDYSRWRDRSVETQRVGWQFLLNRLLFGPQVRGRMLDAKTGQPVNGSIQIQGLRYRDEKPRTARTGIFHKLLVPGNYELKFSAPGYRSQTLAVSVDEKSVIQQDIFFEQSLGIDDDE